MRILHISDTHGQHRELSTMPEADILVHSGDFTFSGSEEEAYDFMNWFCDLPYAHKIFIAGNHDDCMYGADSIDGLPDNVHYLCNSGIDIGGFYFYGIPMFMQDCLTGDYELSFQHIPLHTHVLITHQPPYSICDFSDYGSGFSHHGNKALWLSVQRLHLRLHLFGHEHEANGLIQVQHMVFSNAALLDNQYCLTAEPRLINWDKLM